MQGFKYNDNDMTNYQRAIRILGKKETEDILSQSLKEALINALIKELEFYREYIESFYILKRTWKDYELFITPVRSILISDLTTLNKQEVVAVKYAICKHLRESMELVEIGMIFQTDHSTIIKGLKRFNGLIETNDKLTLTAWNRLQDFLKQNQTGSV